MRQLKPKIKATITIALAIGLFFSSKHFLTAADGSLTTAFTMSIELKQEALGILQRKCNVCHLKKNRRRVFHIYNMSDLAPRIYRQVFVKKRMPKGREIRLTEKEYDILKKWLKAEKIY